MTALSTVDLYTAIFRHSSANTISNKQRLRCILDTRLTELKNWLENELNDDQLVVNRASEDASFRRYFRVFSKKSTYIAMDAPPEKEDCAPFVRVTELLRKCGVHAPKLYQTDLDLGFLLLEDLGSVDYLSGLTSLEDANLLYTDAMQALRQIQAQPNHSNLLADYNETKLAEEMQLFVDWFLVKHHSCALTEIQLDIWKQTQSFLIENCLEQPQVLVHRDFHSRNLMITQQSNPGVIDYQDMVIGPITYDLASIFKDCYVKWNRADQLRWLQEYYQNLADRDFDFTTFVRWYDLTGLQRHLKVLGIFCRLNYRDSKPRYLDDLPLVAEYVLEVLDLYPELQEFAKFFTAPISKTIQ